MEYTKRRRRTVNIESSNLKDIYPHDLQIYTFPPSGEIPYVEFQQLGMERLKLLQHVESLASRTDLKSFDDRKQYLCTVLNKDGLKYFAHLLYAKGCKSSNEIDLQYRRKDHISHFIMRLAFCFEADHRTWFINQEVEWFKLRFSSLDKEGIEKLLDMHDINCIQLTQNEKNEIREELRSSTSRNVNVDTVEFYKVPFQKVADLVRLRRVYLSKGTAFIPQADLISVFVTYFRSILLDSMPDSRFCSANLYGDERLTSFLGSLRGCSSNTAPVVWSSTTTPVQKLDELSKTSYPLCMRTLHDTLKTQHHLRNSGRIQYGLFLKGIGVSLDDSLQFWKTEFSKKIDPDKFGKQYAYGIRHIYGKEGKQTNYTPLGCSKIISSAVNSGEHHGCPFRHMDQESLKQKLYSCGIPAPGVNEIADLARSGDYLIACTTYFKITHNQLPSKAIIHPNVYFTESRAILSKNDPTETESRDRFSQSGRLSDRMSNTPKRIERPIATPSRSVNKSSRNMDRTVTPSRSLETVNRTPTRVAKTVPKKIIDNLNMDEIMDELMNEDM